VLNLEHFFSSVGTAPTTARKEAAHMARKAYNTRVARKTRAYQVKKAATDAEADTGRDKCVSWPGSKAAFETLHTIFTNHLRSLKPSAMAHLI
jgi:hypothetical protein